LEPFILVIEGSIPDETNKAEGYWASLGTDAATGQPITTCEWIDRLAPHAWAVIAVGNCAHVWRHSCDGGQSDRVHGPSRLPRLAMEIEGGDSNCVRAGVSGAAGQFYGDAALSCSTCLPGRAPMIPLDEALRPTWLFGSTVHEGCDRGGYYEQAQFAEQYGSPLCIVKLGCWGPVVQCNVGKRGWMGGIGGCPNVGGICIGCTMPGFPDKFMPFMNQPPGSLLSSAAVQTYGRAIHALRKFTQASLNKAPSWRRKRSIPVDAS
jgi:hydrogenase small subunit